MSSTQSLEGLESDQIVAGQLQNFTIDQFAGAFALMMGAIGTLLLVIWQSRCSCKCRLGCSDKCYIFDCAREPPPLKDIEAEDEEDKDKDKKVKKKKVLDSEQEPIIPPASEAAQPEPQTDRPQGEPEPEPEPHPNGPHDENDDPIILEIPPPKKESLLK